MRTLQEYFASHHLFGLLAGGLFLSCGAVQVSGQSAGLDSGRAESTMFGLGQRFSCAFVLEASSLSFQTYCWGELPWDPRRTSWQPVTLPTGSLRAVVSVAAGQGHVCRLMCPSAGGHECSAVCMGRNDRGQLGVNDDRQVVSEPLEVQLSYVKDVVAFNASSCALSRSGIVYCWGSNESGQLGLPVSPRVSLPRQVLGLPLIGHIALGEHHACAISRSGEVWCWGANPSGELGRRGSSGVLAPTAVPEIGIVSQLHVGSGHSCAITTDGDLYCWGRNSHGQVGAGSTTEWMPPTRVTAISGGRWTDISCGANHSCGVVNNRRVFCWGANDDGQVALTEDGFLSRPTEVAGVDYVGVVVAGPDRSCAVVRDERGLVCWGRNDVGQLGNGPYSRRAGPTAVSYR